MPHYTKDDQDLMTVIKANPEQGFRQLLAVYKEPIYWHIRRIVVSHEDAQDATQEAFVKAFRHIGQYERRNSLKAWLFRIATNEALRLLDRRGACSVLSIDNASVVQTVEADPFYDDSDATVCRLQEAIQRLPYKQQLAFNMRYYDDMPYRDIALVTGSTEANVKANYHVAKEKIIKYMNAND